MIVFFLGGTDHKSVAGVSVINSQFTDKAGVTEEVEPQNNQSIEITHRDMSPLGYRILHFLIYASTISHTDCPLKNVKDHILNDWETMKKILNVGDLQICTLMHQVLFSIKETSLKDVSAINTTEKRVDWENLFEKNIVKPIRDQYETKIVSFIKNMQELSNNMRPLIYDRIDELDKPSNEFCWRRLLRRTIPINFLNFQVVLKNSQQNQLLNHLLKHSKDLKHLKHLKVLLKWCNLLSSHYKLKITLEEARKTKLEQVFGLNNTELIVEEISPFNKKDFDEISNAWNDILDGVTRYQCREQFKIDPLLPSSSLSTLLISSKDDGLFFHAALVYLCELQNQFLQDMGIIANNDKSVALQIIQYQKDITAFESVIEKKFFLFFKKITFFF